MSSAYTTASLAQAFVDIPIPTEKPRGQGSDQALVQPCVSGNCPQTTGT